MGLLTVSDLTGLGQTTLECGEKPGLGPGEKAMCCPGIGWVIYDASESEYALCERARGYMGTDSSGAVVSDDLEARRAALEERRSALEEQRHQEAMETIKMRFALAQVEAQKRAIEEAQSAERRRKIAKLEAEETARRQEKYTKVAIAAVLGYTAYRLLT